ncbi:MAG: carboxypeptidase M32 [Clostridiales bacterium]|nr:carboxypeptidase M32 [Clostridia bacterium]MCR4564165.1 carboxypeptidase M32 [Clostridiales bacterium]
MDMTVSQAREFLMNYQKKLAAYEHAMGSIYYDGSTAAPKGTAENRAQSLSVLSEEMYKIATDEKSIETLEFLDENRAELNERERRMVYLLLKDIREMKKIPLNEFVEYQQLLVMADDVWHKAKEESNFELFRPYLEKIFATNKKFAGYVEPDKDPYDYCLSKFEEGLNKKTLDEFFGKVRNGIVPLLEKISSVSQVDDSIRRGFFPEKEQEELSYYLMKLIGLDLDHVGLATTEHPFTTSLGSHFDERITTHYHEDDFVSSMYSVIHEGGHALYDTGSADENAYTVLDGGMYMSIHESQSRFYENIIGRSRQFCEYVFPFLQKLFPEQMNGRTAEELYKAVNKTEPSLIRTEADEVTYSLHVMIRYELEKRVMAGEIEVKDLPAEWNRMYKEYLGVDVPDDRHGVLQDSHWSGGMVGYFPSYALGNAYGAQFLSKMKKTVDVEKCVRDGNFKPINDWNRENIWVHGGLYTPQETLDRVLGEKFNADYYIEYLNNKIKDVYGL